jgi:hypothetical protein
VFFYGYLRGLKMQKVKSYLRRSKPVCFFCCSEIQPGEEIVSRKESGFYHRKCFDFLSRLTSNQVNWDRVQSQ